MNLNEQVARLKEALQDSNYFLQQYANNLEGNNQAVIYRQCAENKKALLECEPQRTPQEQQAFIMLAGIEEQHQAQQMAKDSLSDLFLKYGIINEYQTKHSAQELKVFGKLLDKYPLTADQLESVLKKVTWFKENKGIKDQYAYINRAIKNEYEKGQRK